MIQLNLTPRLTPILYSKKSFFFMRDYIVMYVCLSYIQQ